jgi:hypothetical protein
LHGFLVSRLDRLAELRHRIPIVRVSSIDLSSKNRWALSTLRRACSILVLMFPPSASVEPTSLLQKLQVDFLCIHDNRFHVCRAFVLP